jgi:DNA-binding transcriptional ArsR family regulator
MDSALRAISAGTRRHILALIWDDERTASEIASEFAMSRPAISQHLKVLLDSDLVLLRREGTRRLYRVNRPAIVRLQAELASFWDDGLARLKHAAERAENLNAPKPGKPESGRKPRRR